MKVIPDRDTASSRTVCADVSAFTIVEQENYLVCENDMLVCL